MRSHSSLYRGPWDFIFIYIGVHKIDPEIERVPGSKMFENHCHRRTFLKSFSVLLQHVFLALLGWFVRWEVSVRTKKTFTLKILKFLRMSLTFRGWFSYLLTSLRRGYPNLKIFLNNNQLNDFNSCSFMNANQSWNEFVYSWNKSVNLQNLFTYIYVSHCSQVHSGPAW